ncbi:hypothetical protein [Trichloromonas sp.]|uniref:hypothetical protein n=1 Tax=Trichloromonas sp. TaxID=3069249 RepID=UPI003D8169AB
MNDYRVDKLEIPVMLFLADGVVHDGIMFLSPFSPSHSGSQRLVDLFRETDTFCPFKTRDGRFCLVNKSSVTHARYPVQNEEETYGDRIKVRLTFYGGELLEGTIIIAMPPGKGRLQDYINSTPGFFCLLTEESHYIVNGDLIREISPG